MISLFAHIHTTLLFLILAWLMHYCLGLCQWMLAALHSWEIRERQVSRLLVASCVYAQYEVFNCRTMQCFSSLAVQRRWWWGSQLEGWRFPHCSAWSHRTPPWGCWELLTLTLRSHTFVGTEKHVSVQKWVMCGVGALPDTCHSCTKQSSALLCLCTHKCPWMPVPWCHNRVTASQRIVPCFQSLELHTGNFWLAFLRGPCWYPSLSTKAAGAGCWLEMCCGPAQIRALAQAAQGRCRSLLPGDLQKLMEVELGTSSAGVGPEVPPPQPLCGLVLQDCSLCSWGRNTAKDVCPCLCLCLEEWKEGFLSLTPTDLC